MVPSLPCSHLEPLIFYLVISMSDYDVRPGGSLKLKGGVAEGGIVKK